MLSVDYYEKYSPLKDIDIDLAPSKRPAIFEAIRKERGPLGLVQVATFGTEGTKSTVLTACRGYRSEEYPDGIDVDTAQYMSSLIPIHRGFLWSLKDVIEGNPDEDRRPVRTFINEAKQYPGLIEIMTSIEGLVNKRSSHASGVILYDTDPYETASFMKTPGGDVITCYDLHKAESAGDTKYDFLVTEISDKIIECLKLLVADNVIEKASLRDLYNKYLHPEVIDTSEKAIWDHLAAGDILDVFQFNTGVGLAIAKKMKPKDPLEMTAANAMMRLMSERGKESQQDRYARIQQQGLEVFDREMHENHLPQSMIDLMHKHCDKYYGCCALQEQMMEILMDVAAFSLGEANSARKVVAKKQMSKIPELKEQVFSRFENHNTAEYFWEIAVAPQLGYAFSLNHSLPYSFVGIQAIYLASAFNPIYWNTSCLIVNSGATDIENGGSTDYGKIAKAIGDIRNAGIKISLVDINRSSYQFAPDVENGQILFGLKGMLNVGDDIIKDIVDHRPYKDFNDFYNKVRPSKQAMISLIKGGAFDNFYDRKFIMGYYLWSTGDKKKRITLQNMLGLIRSDLIPDELKPQQSVFEFNRYLKAACKSNGSYQLDERAMNYINNNYSDLKLDYVNGGVFLDPSIWDKVYQYEMDIVRTWMKEDQDKILNDLNGILFKADWEKYAKGTISAWEMESLCFYYNPHELSEVNLDQYGIVDFFKLPKEPVIDKTFYKAGKPVNIYKLNKIAGTCIAKNKAKGTVTLLTKSGVVNVKFRNEYFSLFDKQISERGEDGVKHVVEKSWFNRGNMIVVMGIRNGDDFVAKKYASSSGHQLYKIDQINDMDLILRDKRHQGELTDEI